MNKISYKDCNELIKKAFEGNRTHLPAKISTRGNSYEEFDNNMIAAVVLGYTPDGEIYKLNGQFYLDMVLES